MVAVLDQVISWLLLLFGITMPFYLILVAIGIRGFKEITSYESYSTFYYRLNPIVKIALSITVMIVAAITVWWIGAIFTLCILGSYLSLKNGKRKFLYGLLFTISILVGTTWAYAPYTTNITLSYAFPGYHPIVLWTWPSYFGIMGYEHFLTLQGLEYGLQVAFRTAAITVSALLLVMTNTPTQILRAFHKAHIPDAIIFTLMVGLKTVPEIFIYLDESIKIQFMRGLGSRYPRFLKPFFMLLGGLYAIVPTIIHLMRGAREIAISADTRGFRATKRRSYVESIIFTRLDYYTLSLIVIILILGIIANFYGFGRPIPYVS
ncbi:MAG: energy-coupling factor transporter transmembrane component T [Candidatus Micrarchaeaceae archaeon]